MPTGERDLAAQVQEQSELDRQARVGGLAGMIPPAQEPLQGSNLSALSKVLARAIPILSGGQVTDVPVLEPAGDLDQVPPELGAEIITLSKFIETNPAKIQGIEQYAFDPLAAMTSNAGLQEVAAIADGLAADPRVMEALQGGAAAPPPQAEEGPELPPEEE